MLIFNFPFLEKVAKNHPALARLIEASIIAVSTYVLGAFMNGEVFSLHAMTVAFLTPLWISLNKRKRDMDK